MKSTLWQTKNRGNLKVLGHTDIKTTMRYAHLESRQVTSKARDVINRLNQRNS